MASGLNAVRERRLLHGVESLLLYFHINSKMQRRDSTGSSSWVEKEKDMTGEQVGSGGTNARNTILPGALLVGGLFMRAGKAADSSTEITRCFS